MTQTTESTKETPARGAYLAGESTASTTPPRAAWVGLVQMPLDGGQVRMVTPRGAEWTARTAHLRPATDDERAAYDAAVPRTGVRA
ncbi:hypothetical protein OHB04_22910 [Streptomyces sp. NBC_01775]|uniref:hypothetical protein n=1 Tax=Streptomyces sp. NBC_01775 TaxID=2975939 RepID=UPI002DDC287D|nr:hypothetical protein [Streptomyces sp. NBC_01775]WSB78345.1 hypothetical protein OHB04_22910 [Streptomyces sp. NBC_01775]